MDLRKGFGSQRGGAHRGRSNRGRQGQPDNRPRLELVPIPRTRGNPFGFDTVLSDRRVPLAHDHPLNLELASTRHELRLRHIYWTAFSQDIPEEMANPGSYDYQRRQDDLKEYDDKIEDLLRRVDFAEQGIAPTGPPVTMSFRPTQSSQQPGAEPSLGRGAMTSVQRRQTKNQNRERIREEERAILNPAFEQETSNFNPTRYSSHPISARQSSNTVSERQVRGTLWTPDVQAAAVNNFHRQMQSDGRDASPGPEPPHAYSPLFFGSDDNPPPPFSLVKFGGRAGSNHGDVEMSGVAEASGPLGSLVRRQDGQVESRPLTTLREQEEALFLEAEAEREQQRNDEAAFHEAEAVREEERLRLSAVVIDQISSDIGTDPRPDSSMQPIPADLTTEDVVQMHTPVQPVPIDTQSRSTGGQFQTIEDVEDVVQMPSPVRPVLASSQSIFTVEFLERDDSDEEVVQMPPPIRLPPAGSQSILAEERFERVREVPVIQASTHPTSDEHLPSFLRNMEQYPQQSEEDELLAEDPEIFHSLMRILSNSSEARFSDEDAVINQASGLPTPGLLMELAEPEPATRVEAPVVRPRVPFVNTLMRATALAALKAAEAEMRKAAASEENKAASTQENHPSTVAGPQKRKLESMQEIPTIPEEDLGTVAESRYKLRPRGRRSYLMKEADPKSEYDTSTDSESELENNDSKVQSYTRLVSDSTSSSEAPGLTHQHPNLRRRAAVTGSLVARYVGDDHASSTPANDRQAVHVETRKRNETTSTTQPSSSIATRPASQTFERKPSRSLFIRNLDNAFEVQDHFPDQDTINMVAIRREVDGNYVVRFNTHENAQAALDRQPPEHKHAQRAIRSGQRRLPYVKWYDEREDVEFSDDSDDGSGGFGAVKTSRQRGASWLFPHQVLEISPRSARPQPRYLQQAPQRSYFDTEAAAPAHPTAQSNTAEAALPSPDPKDRQQVAAMAGLSDAESKRRAEIAGEVEQMMEIVNAPLKTLPKRDRIAHLHSVNEELKLIIKDKERKRHGVALTVTEQKRVNREQDFLHYRRDVLNSLGLSEE